MQERTLIVHAPKTRRHRPEPRTVRLLAPLAADLREWRMASGRPGPDAPVFSARMGGEWTDVGFDRWRCEGWTRALEAAGLPYQRPYDLRHSFASLLLHEGRSVIYVARQLGHGADLTMRTYGHVMDELEGRPEHQRRRRDRRRSHPSGKPCRAGGVAMTLYHCDLRGNIESVLCDGFHEGGVWLSDISLLDDADPPLGDEFAQVVGAAPDDGLDGFEAVGNPSVGGGYREFRIPAAVVNAWPRRLGERRGTDVRTEFGRA